MPRDEHAAVTVLCCLLPGLPYAGQLYLLPIMGVPLATITGCGASLHTVRAAVSIIGGDLSDELTPATITWLSVYYLVNFGVCFYLLRRLCRRLNFQSARFFKRTPSACNLPQQTVSAPAFRWGKSSPRSPLKRD